MTQTKTTETPASPRPLGQVLMLAADYLRRRGSPSARLDAELLLAHVLGFTRLDLYVQFDRPLMEKELAPFRELVRRRGRGEPVAYLVGQREFRSRTFMVNPAVLIPRPETELLVETALEALADTPPGWAVDVGTGSGAIAVTLALEAPSRSVAAVDVSAAALDVARANARRHGVEETITWLQGDLLAPVVAARCVPLTAVVSNPPYVATGDWERLDPTVRDYEPRIALDGGEDGLRIIARLIAESATYLAPGGFLALEIGAGQQAGVAQLLAEAGFEHVQWRHDGAGHPRVALARQPDRGGRPVP